MSQASVILLHGRGGSSEDILTLREEFAVPGVAWYAPQAPGHSWYPYSFLAPIEQNEPWLSQALEQIGKIAAGIAPEKLVIAGFSQGACLATEFVARNPARYGGLIAFTGGLIGPLGKTFEYPGSLAGTPAFLGSGDPDPHVPWSRVQESADTLTQMGADVVVRRYPGMAHTVSPSEIAEARKIIIRALPGGTG
ncbi:MAG TPA: dienelactone hydrolase family protein [Candidatus Sulfopaludibacter sp.]|jgi:predicted esterase|nr:dienelactone hydrolase family protein [Candidatus Sulfopaludibacter sp.]